MKYKFSQSALKEFEEDANCPLRWKAVHIDKTDRFDIGGAADVGNYFEHKCLGTNTGVMEMEPLKSGGISALEKRVLKQVEVFKNMHNPEHDSYIGEQVYLANITLDTDEEKGILDYSTHDKDDNLTWWDMKMVGDLDRGYYRYGDHDRADYTQQIYYKMLLKANGHKDFKMGLIIFESAISARVKIIMLNIGEEVTNMLKERLKDAKGVMEQYNEKGWVTYPSIDECKKCNLTCQERHQETPLKDLEQQELQAGEEQLLEDQVQVVEVSL